MSEKEDKKDKEDMVKGFTTNCRTCVFAKSDVVFPISKQAGCQLGRIEKFKETGRLKKDGNFFIINGICNTCRGNEWLTVQKTNNPIATVEREIEICVDMVLYSINESKDIINKIGMAINSCVKQQKIKPKKIVIVIQNKDANYREIYYMIQEITESYDVPFQLVRILEEDADINRSVAMGIDKCTSHFVAVFDLNNKIQTNFITRLNHLINYNMSRMIMIEPLHGYSGMVLQTSIFKLLGKNNNMPIFEKVREIAEEQNNTNMILTWDVLWNHK